MDKVRQVSTSEPPKTSEEMAMFLATLIRNAMEEFHYNHLSDEQMEELNPIIRNSIFSGLEAVKQFDDSDAAKLYVNLQRLYIPANWEKPELLRDFVEFYKHHELPDSDYK